MQTGETTSGLCWQKCSEQLASLPHTMYVYMYFGVDHFVSLGGNKGNTDLEMTFLYARLVCVTS